MLALNENVLCLTELTSYLLTGQSSDSVIAEGSVVVRCVSWNPGNPRHEAIATLWE